MCVLPPVDQELSEHGDLCLPSSSSLQSPGRGPRVPGADAPRGTQSPRQMGVPQIPFLLGRNLGQIPQARRLVTAPDSWSDKVTQSRQQRSFLLTNLPNLFQMDEMPRIWGEGAEEGSFYPDLLSPPVPESPHY